jgi:hypothetical protein
MCRLPCSTFGKSCFSGICKQHRWKGLSSWAFTTMGACSLEARSGVKLMLPDLKEKFVALTQAVCPFFPMPAGLVDLCQGRPSLPLLPTHALRESA